MKATSKVWSVIFFAFHKRLIVGGAALFSSYSMKKRIDSRIIMEEIL